MKEADAYMKNERGAISMAFLPIILLLLISAGITIYQKYSYNIMDTSSYSGKEDIDLRLKNY